jgi:glyoxylase-like metal-dependent hydrolase (beta-lactamase superfamily II)
MRGQTTVGRGRHVLFVLAAAALAALAPLGAQQDGGAAPLQVLPVQGNVHVIQGAGANIAAQVGPDGVVLADAGSAASAEAVLAALRGLTRQPIRYIINTGPGADHVGGNQALAAAGRSLFDRGCCGNDVERARSNNGSASLVGPENLLLHMSQDGYPVVAWPTEVFIEGESKNLFLNDEPIQVFYQPAAHSDADSVIHFRRSDVVVTGEIFDMTRFPEIDLSRGGTIQGEIDALNRMIQLVVPSIPLPYVEGGTKVIPARGRISEQAELVEYRDMVTIIRDRVQALIDQGRTLDEIQAANPANGFRGRFGADTGPWTTADFVEAVYRGLAGGA